MTRIATPTPIHWVQTVLTATISMRAILGADGGGAGISPRRRRLRSVDREPQRPGDAGLERVGHLVAALGRDHDLELGLEVERLEAGAAGAEVVLDGGAPLVGELPVEEFVQFVECVVAVAHAQLRSRHPKRVW